MRSCDPLRTMFSFNAFDAKTERLRRDGTGTPDMTAGFHADPAKAFVLACIRRLVADGHAQWHALDSGDIQLAFNTGEMFLLAKTVIVRLA